MRFRIVYLENADVIAAEASYEAALARLRHFLLDHPEMDDEVGIQEVDDGGRPVGDMTVGIDVVGQQMHLHAAT